MKLFDEIPYLEDDVIILRKMTEEDASVLEAMGRNQAVQRYLPAFLYENQFEDKKEAIRGIYGELFDRKESLMLGIYQKSDPKCLCGIAEIYGYEDYWNKASIGLRLDEPYQGKGIGKHALGLLKDYLFGQTDIKRITCHIMADNIGSHKVFSSHGFRLRKVKCEEDWGFKENAIVNKYVIEKLGNISYIRIGNGPKPMIILPGLAFKSCLGSKDILEQAYAEKFKDYSIYLFDDRSNFTEGYSLRERAGDIAAEMRTLHIKAANVWGVSMGGMVAQYLTIDHPNLVKKLVLTSTTSELSEPSLEIVHKWLDLAIKGEKEKLINESVKDIYAKETVRQYGDIIKLAIGVVSDQELEDFITLIHAILKLDTYKELDKITCPVLVTAAEGDKVLFDGPERIAKKLGCKIIMYDDSYGHAVYDEAPDHKDHLLAFFGEEVET